MSLKHDGEHSSPPELVGRTLCLSDSNGPDMIGMRLTVASLLPFEDQTKTQFNSMSRPWHIVPTMIGAQIFAQLCAKRSPVSGTLILLGWVLHSSTTRGYCQFMKVIKDWLPTLGWTRFFFGDRNFVLNRDSDQCRIAVSPYRWTL
jgi:hypothetical protein